MNDKSDGNSIENKKTEYWSSYYGFIFAAIGSAKYLKYKLHQSKYTLSF
jgi:hypothetical protein